MAATLTEAAHLTYVRTNPLWLAGTFQAQLALFIDDISPSFMDDVVNDRPVGNWIPLLQASLGAMPVGVLPLDLWDEAVTRIYRICLAGSSQLAGGLITAGQAAALLAAWNARFGP